MRCQACALFRSQCLVRVKEMVQTHQGGLKKINVLYTKKKIRKSKLFFSTIQYEINYHWQTFFFFFTCLQIKTISFFAS
jgi:hypothetical protein